MCLLASKMEILLFSIAHSAVTNGRMRRQSMILIWSITTVAAAKRGIIDLVRSELARSSGNPVEIDGIVHKQVPQQPSVKNGQLKPVISRCHCSEMQNFGSPSDRKCLQFPVPEGMVCQF